MSSRSGDLARLIIRSLHPAWACVCSMTCIIHLQGHMVGWMQPGAGSFRFWSQTPLGDPNIDSRARLHLVTPTLTPVPSNLWFAETGSFTLASWPRPGRRRGHAAPGSFPKPLWGVLAAVSRNGPFPKAGWGRRHLIPIWKARRETALWVAGRGSRGECHGRWELPRDEMIHLKPKVHQRPPHPANKRV